jgi:hypothetical protein
MQRCLLVEKRLGIISPTGFVARFMVLPDPTTVGQSLLSSLLHLGVLVLAKVLLVRPRM